MRDLLAEPGQGGFDADKLINPPLVFIWIPVAVTFVGLLYCVVRCGLKRRKEVRRGVKDVLYYQSEFESHVDSAPPPQDDDRPLPRRHLARISHSSAASNLHSEVGQGSSGKMLGISHAQLQKLQLADIANMLLPERTASIHSQSGGLPFITLGSQGENSVVADASDATFGVNDIYHDAQSGKELSAPLDHTGTAPSPGTNRMGIHSSRNSLSQLPAEDTTQNTSTRERHVWAVQQQHSSAPVTPSDGRRRSGGKSRHMLSPVSAFNSETVNDQLAAAVDSEPNPAAQAARYVDSSENGAGLNPEGLEL